MSPRTPWVLPASRAPPACGAAPHMGGPTLHSQESGPQVTPDAQARGRLCLCFIVPERTSHLSRHLVSTHVSSW